MTAKRERVCVRFPKATLDDLRALVPARHRSAFIVAVTARETERLKLCAALAQTAGAWKDEDYPELATDEDIDRWIRGLRAGWRPREEKNGDA